MVILVNRDSEMVLYNNALQDSLEIQAAVSSFTDSAESCRFHRDDAIAKAWYSKVKQQYIHFAGKSKVKQGYRVSRPHEMLYWFCSVFFFPLTRLKSKGRKSGRVGTKWWQIKTLDEMCRTA